jgi:hypothetical protein
MHHSSWASQECYKARRSKSFAENNPRDRKGRNDANTTSLAWASVSATTFPGIAAVIRIQKAGYSVTRESRELQDGGSGCRSRGAKYNVTSVLAISSKGMLQKAVQAKNFMKRKAHASTWNRTRVHKFQPHGMTILPETPDDTHYGLSS